MLSLNNHLPPATPATLPSPSEPAKTHPAAQTKSDTDFRWHPLHWEMQEKMRRFLKSMEPPPSLSAMREQVPNDAWKKRDGVATDELSELVNTPIGRKMSQALQMEFGGSNFNALTWWLAGLASLMVNANEFVKEYDGYDNYHIDFFDWGGDDKNPAAIFEHLKKFLVKYKLATPELAGAMAYVRLWKSAPEFLLRDIPAGLDKNSPEWKRVSEKVGKLVLDTPLQTLGMTYDDVLDLIDPTRVKNRFTFF